MDAQRLRAISRLPSRARCARRVQRQIHDQPNGAARLVAGNAGRPFAPDLSQFLLSVRPLAIHRIAAGGIPELSVSPKVQASKWQSLRKPRYARLPPSKFRIDLPAT